MSNLPAYLLRHPAARSRATHASYGLDFWEIIFEILDYKRMHEVAAFGGFPVRYPHWRFGMDFEHLTKSHVYGLSKIYEMVINNNPAYAYLLEGNSLVDQKMVMAHVLRARRLLQEQLLLLQDQPEDDRQHGQPRHPRAPPHRTAGPGQGRGLHRRLPVPGEPDRSDVAVHRAQARPRSRDDGRGRPRRRKEVPRLRAKDYMDGFINPPEYMAEQRKQAGARARQAQEVPRASRSATCCCSC